MLSTYDLLECVVLVEILISKTFKNCHLTFFFEMWTIQHTLFK